VSRCCSWLAAWNRYGRNFSCFVTRWAPVTDKYFLYPEVLLPVGVLCLIQHFLVRIHIPECFATSSKRFWCEEMFENESFCSRRRHVCICAAFAQLVCAAFYKNGACDLSVTGRLGERITRRYTGVDLLVSFWYRRTCLFLCYIFKWFTVYMHTYVQAYVMLCYLFS
jgi:hypothetical protein